MELTFNLEDELATRFAANKSKEKLDTLFTSWVNHPLANEDEMQESPLEFFGMWKDKDIDPVTYVRELRKGRQFDFSGCDFSTIFPPKNI